MYHLEAEVDDAGDDAAGNPGADQGPTETSIRMAPIPLATPSTAACSRDL